MRQHRLDGAGHVQGENQLQPANRSDQVFLMNPRAWSSPESVLFLHPQGLHGGTKIILDNLSLRTVILLARELAG
jgi:hypothetical protein